MVQQTPSERQSSRHEFATVHAGYPQMVEAESVGRVEKVGRLVGGGSRYLTYRRADVDGGTPGGHRDRIPAWDWREVFACSLSHIIVQWNTTRNGSFHVEVQGHGRGRVWGDAKDRHTTLPREGKRLVDAGGCLFLPERTFTFLLVACYLIGRVPSCVTDFCDLRICDF